MHCFVAGFCVWVFCYAHVIYWQHERQKRSKIPCGRAFSCIVWEVLNKIRLGIVIKLWVISRDNLCDDIPHWKLGRQLTRGECIYNEIFTPFCISHKQLNKISGDWICYWTWIVSRFRNETGFPCTDFHLADAKLVLRSSSFNAFPSKYRLMVSIWIQGCLKFVFSGQFFLIVIEPWI